MPRSWLVAAVRAAGAMLSATRLPAPEAAVGFAFTNIGRAAGLDVRIVFGGQATNKYLLETTGTGVALIDAFRQIGEVEYPRMALTPGTRIGPYEVIDRLGAGGMGEVYRARDPRLDRVVAIKVLPSNRADDPERQQRFDREARAVAALSHPNICAIYDVGHAPSTSSGQGDGAAYLVMEYLDGETLADRVAAGGRAGSADRRSRSSGSDHTSGGTTSGRTSGTQPLPIHETLGIATQLAQALAAAHNAGIVHRDLKPANVVLLRSGSTRDGVPQVKVLDFGLARIAKQPSSEPQMTMAAPLTGIGMLVGTVPYMSPEQVEGRDVDARSDIFSLGSVIYEMATGRRAFDAGSQAGVIAAILERQPEPITQVQPMAPAGLDRIVRACLAKSPDDRWQHAGDVARQLSWLATESEPGVERRSSPDVQPAAAKTETGRSTTRGAARWPLMAAALAAVLVAGDVLWRLLGASSSAASPVAIPAHFPLRIDGVTIQGVRVSPDGRTLAIAGTRADGRAGTWVQGLSDGRAVEVPNLDADVRLFGWSLDGTEILCRSSRGVVAVRVDGWLVRPVTPALAATVTAVGERELLVGGESGIRAVAFGTGTARELLSGLALRPRFLPDGRRFLYTSRADTKNQGNPDGLYLSSVDAPQERRLILSKRSSGVYASGSLLFVDAGTLFAQPFDLVRAELSGTPRPVLDGVRYFHPNGAAIFDAGAGTLVYETPPPDDSPVWIDRQGAIVGKLSGPGFYTEPRISPDGTRAVYSRRDRRQGTGDLWLQDLATHTTVRLTNDEWSEASLTWSPDGRTIAYGSDREGPPDVYLQDVNGGASRKFFATDAVDYPQYWLPDGRLVVMTAGRFVAVRPDGTIDETVRVRSRGVASADGLWLAFATTESGESGLYVEPLGREGLRRRIAVDNISGFPVWSRDGKSLYFASNRRMMQAAVRTGAAFASEPATVVFTLDRDIADFNVSPDGQKFLVWRAPSPDFAPYRVLVNWPAVLK